MPLTVGTDTYLSLTDANTYWSNKNNSTWAAASDANKEKALREATQYIDGAYCFIGYQKTEVTNLLAWPRHSAYVTTGNFAGTVYDSDTIPPQVKNACAELALECLTDRIDPAAARGGLIKREKVDVIEVEYLDWAPSGKTFNFVTRMLSPLLKGGSGPARKLVRT